MTKLWFKVKCKGLVLQINDLRDYQVQFVSAQQAAISMSTIKGTGRSIMFVMAQNQITLHTISKSYHPRKRVGSNDKCCFSLHHTPNPEMPIYADVLSSNKYHQLSVGHHHGETCKIWTGNHNNSLTGHSFDQIRNVISYLQNK